MLFIKNKRTTLFLLISAMAISFLTMPVAEACHPFDHYFIVQGGEFYSQRNHHPQDIAIEGLTVDHFTVNKHYDWNFLLGLGFFGEGFDWRNMIFWYGIDAFYLAPVRINGSIIQEQLPTTTLLYQYEITNWPLYAMLRTSIHSYCNLDFVFDLGLGVNFLETSVVNEKTLQNVPIQNGLFLGETNAVFSATLGLSMAFSYWHSAPIEIGYRFFYLGNGTFKRNTNQALNTLTTGYNYANALVLSITL